MLSNCENLTKSKFHKSFKIEIRKGQFWKSYNFSVFVWGGETNDPSPTSLKRSLLTNFLSITSNNKLVLHFFQGMGGGEWVVKYSFPSHLFMVVKMIIGLCGECFDMIGLLAFYYSGGAAAYVAVPPLMWRRCRLCGGAAAYVAKPLLISFFFILSYYIIDYHCSIACRRTGSSTANLTKGLWRLFLGTSRSMGPSTGTWKMDWPSTVLMKFHSFFCLDFF